MSDAGEFTEVSTAATSRVEVVRLYTETWGHIVEQHPEFSSQIPSLEHAIVDTIVNPTLVCKSTTQPETTVVFASSNNVNGTGRMLSVPVRIVGSTTSGRVTTAMFGSPPRGDVIFDAEGGEND